MTTQYITDKKGNKLAVILPIKDYNKILLALEELEDQKLYDEVEEGEQEYIDVEQAFQEIEENRKDV